MIRNALALLLVIAGLTKIAYSQNGIGQRQNGEQLLNVQYLQAQSPVPATLTVPFFFDGGARVENITFVATHEQTDSVSLLVVFHDGGAGVGLNFINFTLGAYDATYYRAECHFYGFYRDD